MYSENNEMFNNSQRKLNDILVQLICVRNKGRIWTLRQQFSMCLLLATQIIHESQVRVNLSIGLYIHAYTLHIYTEYNNGTLYSTISVILLSTVC
jgi:hypothetical protein